MTDMWELMIATAAATSIAVAACYERHISNMLKPGKPFDQHVHEMLEVLEPQTGPLR